MGTNLRYKRDLHLSKYATIKTKGRKYPLKEDEFRTEFQRDCHRIIYSQAFRRLKHKTQVFYFPQNDHISTRIEHVLLVASAARTVARCLELNEDLAEAIGLGHDIGHAPFGHEGERILDSIIKGDTDQLYIKNLHEKIRDIKKLQKIIPEFHHEIYGLRVVDKLAKLDREPPGLNLTWEVRDGILSHCGEKNSFKLEPYNKHKDLESIKTRETAPLPITREGCLVRIIDRIAYAGRDLEDAIRAQIVNEEEIPPEIKNALGKNNGTIVKNFLEDLIKNSHEMPYITLSEEKGNPLKKLIEFNGKKIYDSSQAQMYKDRARKIIELLFEDLWDYISQDKRNNKNSLSPKNGKPNVYKVFDEFLDDDMKNAYTASDPNSLKVLDFIAGMTDNFIVQSFQELFVPKATV